MKDADFTALEAFLKKYANHFITFSDIDLEHVGNRSMIDRLLSWLFFTQRKLRGLR